jgi:tRNA (pseudouridine54-N1)-methyltransferase
MREIIYYSRSAPTAGNFVKEDLQKSGRLDIAIHTVIASFFLSHQFREDVKLHLIFAGMPDPTKHLELKPVTEGEVGVDKIYLSKSNIADVIKRMLYKYKEGKKHEVYPGYWIEKKGFLEVVGEMNKQGRNIYILDGHGEDIRTAEIGEDPIFILGDHNGLPSKELKRLKSFCKPISIGNRTYFASQTVAIVNNELDRREDALVESKSDVEEDESESDDES